MLATLIRLTSHVPWRRLRAARLIPACGWGDGASCTQMTELAAATYGWAALPYVMMIDGECSTPTPSRFPRS